MERLRATPILQSWRPFPDSSTSNGNERCYEMATSGKALGAYDEEYDGFSSIPVLKLTVPCIVRDEVVCNLLKLRRFSSLDHGFWCNKKIERLSPIFLDRLFSRSHPLDRTWASDRACSTLFNFLIGSQINNKTGLK